MLHRSKSLRTFFGILFVVLVMMSATPVMAVAVNAEDRSPSSVVTELKVLWGRVLEWVGVRQSAGPQEGGDPTSGAEGENNAEGNPSIDPLG